MQIRLPRLPRWGVRALHWLNKPLWRDILRIDVLLAILGLACTGYYGYLGGMIGALQGGGMFAFVTLTVLWFRP